MHHYAAQEILRIGNENIPSRDFTFNQLKVATENFNARNLLGEGGFGRVFKGRIQETNEVLITLYSNTVSYSCHIYITVTFSTIYIDSKLDMYSQMYIQNVKQY